MGLKSLQSPSLFYEWNETQVEAAALWSLGFSTYLYVHNSNLFTLLRQFDILIIFKYILQTFCLKSLLNFSNNEFVFLQQLVTGSSVQAPKAVKSGVEYFIVPVGKHFVSGIPLLG